MLNDALFAMITLLKMNARDSSVIHSKIFLLSRNLQPCLQLSLYLSFLSQQKQKTKLALVIAFGIPVMEYSR